MNSQKATPFTSNEVDPTLDLQKLPRPHIIKTSRRALHHIRITAKLRQEKVWDTVTTSPPAATTETQSHAESWFTHDSKAAGIIVAHVSDCLALKVGELAHAKEMYDKLVKIHQDMNVGVGAFYTFFHMLNVKWDGSPSTLNDHIATISAADSKFTAMKKQIDPEFLAFISYTHSQMTTYKRRSAQPS
ncbi:hypothetical protein H2248_004047 [Termitomyces sp. 'cryptogamus']|nr:hypothetical protein H2248_007022 [Termitomyces sp. 'cryptogamus']KAH0578172.1 hypothetical protein H2248_004047 [Termitomyces sp. 'cryptogamus']